MALYAPVTLNFRCSYQPCQYEEDISFFNEDMSNFETRHCPKCGLFTLKYKPLPLEVKDELGKVLSGEKE